MPSRPAAALAALICLTCVLAPAPASATPPPRHAAAPAHAASLAGRADAMKRFASEVAERRALPARWLTRQLSHARRVPAVRQLIMPPAAGAAKNWAAYRDRFIEPGRIGAGLAFWRANQRWLDLAEQRWGVPPEIVVAIVGVETFYGRVTGRFRTLDALATLAFDFPPGRRDRSAFFRSELEEFFVLCAREGIDPQRLRGSYAGAIGLAQFMPSSLNRLAVDLDGDGRVDLAASAADAVGSVAHYLAQAGWENGLPTHFEVVPPALASEREALLAPDVRPSFSAEQFAEHGALLDDAGRATLGPLALIELQNGGDAPTYVAGTQNFHALTRYNWSSYYAMAVIELARAIRDQR